MINGKTAALLKNLKDRDIIIEADGNELNIDAPKGSLTSEIISLIKENKGEIIEFLNSPEKKNKFIEIEPAPKKDHYRVSSAQKRMYLFQQMDLGNVAYNIPQIIPVMDITPDRIMDAAGKLIERHESFRTSFHMVNDEPVQKIHENVIFELDHFEASDNSDIDRICRSYVKPFDLGKAPLLRIGYIKNHSGSGNYIVADMHHIISDGISMELLRHDFISILEGRVLEPLKLQYKDYSEWQHSDAQREEMVKQEKYWLGIYKDGSPVLNLPNDFNRPEVYRYEGSSAGFRINKEQTVAIRERCLEANVTLHTYFLALFNILLSKLSGQDDIVVGMAIAGRHHPGLEDIIGMFVNMLALRNNPSDDLTFGEFLGDVNDSMMSALENQDLQFDDLVEKIGGHRDLSRNPVFDVGFIVLKAPEGNEEAEFSGSISKSSKVDLLLMAAESPDSINISLEYNVALFRHESVERFLKAFRKIIDSTDFNRKLSEFYITDEEEKKLILEKFNSPCIPEDPRYNIVSMFDEQALRTPDSVALTFNGNDMSFRDLHYESNRIAAYLRDNTKGNECVALLFRPSFEMIISILSVLRSGNHFIPINPDLPESKIVLMTGESGSSVMLIQKEFVKLADRIQWSCSGLKRYLCTDSHNVYKEEESSNESGDPELWEIIGKRAVDDITGGGWLNSYTGEPFTRQEMDEYGQNIVLKLSPYINNDTRILEVGCASGISMFNLAPKAGFYYGTDLSEVIIEKDRIEAGKRGINNIKLQSLPAIEVDKVTEKDFDIVIMNSVIQCFDGYNYLRDVIRKSVCLMSDKGMIFAGDIMDQDLKQAQLDDLIEFSRNNTDPEVKTKTELDIELLVSKDFWTDLTAEFPEIRKVEFSKKIYTIENELTKYRYDAILFIDKDTENDNGVPEKIKYQDDLRILEKYDNGIKSVNIEPEDPAYIIYTSGSSGVPKGVINSHSGIANTLRYFIKEYGLGPKNTSIQLISYFFDAFMSSFFVPLLSGSRIVLADRDTILSDDALRETINSYNIDYMVTTPSLFKTCLERCTKLDRIPEKVVLGGDRIDHGLLNTVKKLSRKTEVIVEYGITEASVVSTVNRHQEGHSLVHIGSPIRNTQIFITDSNLRLQPVQVAGEILIGGAGVAPGYLSRPELTKEKFIWWDPDSGTVYEESDRSAEAIRVYRSGDQGRWLPDGSIEFLGRLDDQVKIRGFRIETGEIESNLLEIEGVSESAVIARNDDSGSKYLCAYTVTDPGINEKYLRQKLSENLPDYMIPSYFVFMDSIPLTSNGKIDRRSLPEPMIDVKDYIPPTNETEKKLAKIWSEVLGSEKDKISLDSNFFDLGGHSLKATTLMSRIHKEFNVRMPLADIFKYPEIGLIAPLIDGMQKSRHSAIEPVQFRDHYVLSSAQKRLYILAEMEPGNTVYNMPLKTGISGHDTADIETALKTILDRHESLRTSFKMVNDEPAQIIHENIELDIERFSASDENEAEEIFTGFVRPFDLGKAPLIRAGIIEMKDGRKYLITDMHHIISDGVSMEILGRDFVSVLSGKTLPPLRLQYKDYAEWQNSSGQQESVKAQEKFWIDMYSDEIPVLILPYDHPRPVQQSFEGRGVSYVIGRELTSRVRDICRDTEITLSTYLLSAFSLLLSKLSGSNDVVTGITSAGRRHSDLEGIIGMFVNTLAVRNVIDGSFTYSEYLRKVNDRVLSAYENQEYQFEDLVENLNIVRDAGRNPLFDVMFNVLNMGDGMYGSDRDGHGKHVDSVAKFDLTLNVLEGKDIIELNLNYCSRLFKAETIDRFFGYFMKILDGVDLEKRISGIDILSPEEKHYLVRELNDTSAGYPKDMTVHDYFAESAEKYPEMTALVFDGKGMSYRELDERSNCLARKLRELGVKRNGIVGIMTDRSFEMIIGILGILKSGGGYMPIDPAYPSERRLYMCEDSGTEVLLSTGRIYEDFGYDGTVLFLDEESSYSDDGGALEKVNEPSDLCYVIYTSGTTGKPKGALIEHRNVVRLFFNDKALFDFNETDVWTMFHSYCFDFSVWEMYGALLYGGKLVIIPSDTAKDTGKYAELLESEKVTVLNQTPSSFYSLVNIDMSGEAKNYVLRYVIFGGEALMPLKLKEWHERYPDVKLINMYGITETTVHVTYKEIGDYEIEHNISNIGKPIPTLTAYVVDRDLNLAAPGVAGELCVGGDGVCRGYLDREDLTNEKFVESPFVEGERLYRTGDLAKLLPDGELEYMGRIDSQVKIRGFRIETGEIESCLLKIDGISESVVIAKDDNTGGRYLCAYIVSSKDTDDSDIKAGLSGNLPEYMIPSYIVRIDSIPLTSNGKIDRRSLPEPEIGVVNEYVAPGNETEEKLVEIWSEVLGLEKEKISIDSNIRLRRLN